MFKEAGLTGPPNSFDELLAFAQRMVRGEKTGFLTLNFDWLYWLLFKMNGVELLTSDATKAAFNTPQTAEVLDRLAKSTDTGAINKISWTGRWVEPNGAFASNTVGMLHAHSSSYFFVKGQGSWLNADTLGVLTGNRWATEFSRRRKLLTGNIAADTQGLELMRKEDPLAAQVLQTQLEHTDKFCGDWTLPVDAQLKDALYPEIQNAIFGRKDARRALSNAERAVNCVLSKRG